VTGQDLRYDLCPGKDPRLLFMTGQGPRSGL